MKKVLLGITVIGAALLSQAASADSWSSRHNRHGYNNHSYGNHYRGYSSQRRNSYHYGRRDRRSNNYFNISYGSHYGDYYGRRRHHDSGSFLGGLVLGSLLTYPSYSSRRYDREVYRSAPVTREIVYVNRTAPQRSAPVPSGRRLLRDLEGNCFERIVDEEGNEVRIQLEAAECSF